MYGAFGGCKVGAFAMKGDQPGFSQPEERFEIFDRVISTIESTAGLKFSIASRVPLIEAWLSAARQGLKQPSQRELAVEAANNISQNIKENIGDINKQFELLHAIVRLMWMYGEARAAFAYAEALESAEGFAQEIVEKQDKNKEQLRSARQEKEPATLIAEGAVTRYGFEAFFRLPQSRRSANNVAGEILEHVNRDLEAHGLKPLKKDAIRKRLAHLIPGWISSLG
jgi:hypothetical protein